MILADGFPIEVVSPPTNESEPKNAGFRLPFVGGPLGVVQPFGFSRRFVLRHRQ
jgi:hypothetical protein